jgi:hypothetical protein
MLRNIREQQDASYVSLHVYRVGGRARIRGALAADDALKRNGLAVRFRVRETPDWKKHAADLESEMLKRGMRFEVIDWSEDQPTG